MLDCFYYKFKTIPWILSYKWADYWPYLEFIYLIFSMLPSVVMCITMGYLFHVWGGVGVRLVFLVISICTEFLGFFEGKMNNKQLNKCFWNIWVALKRAGRTKTHPDWLLSRLLLLRRCCGGDSKELLLLRLLSDLC